MRWITRERPKIDRLACPWLIKRFVDAGAEFIYVPFNDVLPMAAQLNAIPFDIAGVEYTHYDDLCTFDYIIKKHHIEDSAVLALAPIVRGADTDRHDLAPQASGLWAISAGMAYDEPDDHKLLEKGMLLYDSLYSWAKYLQHVKHTQQPFENQLLDIFNKFLQREKDTKKIPAWAKELKEIIQDQIDTNLNLSLKGLSETLQVHPAYLSREFSKYFDNLSFGDYIRKLRIDKAIQLLSSTNHSLTEIAYLTGFSDQSHFTRIFRIHTGKSPSAYKKSLGKK
ncbi:chromate resistance protein ChrB domain-containing protein [Chitinophaga ginsengisegetis]|uniref:chromate resistance protein ChrB domain-containing protein n=1 Tax=Chitinophaga ginsengisegetis TaxID=393003 RepID=UPI000DBA6DC4|nr:chromate resistance protein ChrB domain-containing protein [Chitinophaga ginsengisegetis]MDR6571159.1 AraC-like DNA-binding protein [Chitinophaga ginsengisegetis]MDR6650893.1 AraC-like DNA-binding protein [Chitinophaga ginsengisegetis]MDR6657220.1 AraC-like DNA-binding protein [Chitinophaga ginsengisegetis]